MLLLDVRDADRTRLRYAGGLTGRRAADLADGRLLFRATGACNDGLLHVHERTATRRQDGHAIPVRIGHPWRVARHLRLDEFLLGVEGIALMRHLFDDDALAETRLEEIRRIACVEEGVYQLGVDVPIVDVASGYARWSQTYDNPGNPLIQIEQPVVGPSSRPSRAVPLWTRRAGPAVTHAAWWNSVITLSGWTRRRRCWRKPGRRCHRPRSVTGT